MPTRFPTEAANDPAGSRQVDDAPSSIGADGTPRGRADGTPDPYQRPRSGNTRQRPREADAKPGNESGKS